MQNYRQLAAEQVNTLVLHWLFAVLDYLPSYRGLFLSFSKDKKEEEETNSFWKGKKRVSVGVAVFDPLNTPRLYVHRLFPVFYLACNIHVNFEFKKKTFTLILNNFLMSIHTYIRVPIF